MLLGSITNFTKVLCRALQLWTLARKLAVMDEWGGRRVILFLGSPFKMLKVRDCKKIWNWIMRGSALTSKIKIRKFDSVIASSELTSSTYTHSLHENCPNTEFFLVRISPYFDWIRENTDQKKNPCLDTFHTVTGLGSLS